jgi:hypothetical protein
MGTTTYGWQALFLEFKLTMVRYRTLYVYAHADLAQKYSVGLQELFVSKPCAPRKKIIFSCPLSSSEKG